jgi:hypothetical protein
MNLQEILKNTKSQKRILENYYDSLPPDFNLFYANKNIYCYDNNKILLKIKSSDNREQRIQYIDSLKKQYTLHFLKKDKIQTDNMVLFYETFLYVSKEEGQPSVIDTDITYIKENKSGNVESSRYMFSMCNNFHRLLKTNLEIETSQIAKFDLSDGKPDKIKVPNEIKYKRKNTRKFDLIDKEERKEKLPNLIRFQNLDMEQ